MQPNSCALKEAGIFSSLTLGLGCGSEPGAK
jgi:hypothetical protein